MRFVIPVALACSVLFLARPSQAASPIVTPGIHASAGGTLSCLVVNASDTKTLEVEIAIRSFDGTDVAVGIGTVIPGGANALASSENEARFCIVRVIRGGRKNAIVSLTALEGGVPVAVVAAPR
jgi:hypothetical protein